MSSYIRDECLIRVGLLERNDISYDGPVPVTLQGSVE